MSETCQNPQMCCYIVGAIAGVIGFVLGAIATCIVCKLRGKSYKCCGDKKPYEKKPGKKFDSPRFEKRHPAPADGSIEIYVGNLNYDLTDDILRKEFEAFGTVNSARIITNKFNGKSKGFGFVHMPNRDEVEKAVAALNDKDILGRKLKCNVAKNVV